MLQIKVAPPQPPQSTDPTDASGDARGGPSTQVSTVNPPAATVPPPTRPPSGIVESVPAQPAAPFPGTQTSLTPTQIMLPTARTVEKTQVSSFVGNQDTVVKPADPSNPGSRVQIQDQPPDQSNPAQTFRVKNPGQENSSDDGKSSSTTGIAVGAALAGVVVLIIGGVVVVKKRRSKGDDESSIFRNLSTNSSQRSPSPKGKTFSDCSNLTFPEFMSPKGTTFESRPISQFSNYNVPAESPRVDTPASSNYDRLSPSMTPEVALPPPSYQIIHVPEQEDFQQSYAPLSLYSVNSVGSRPVIAQFFDSLKGGFRESASYRASRMTRDLGCRSSRMTGGQGGYF